MYSLDSIVKAVGGFMQYMIYTPLQTEETLYELEIYCLLLKTLSAEHATLTVNTEMGKNKKMSK